ncbi:MAG: GNAT family N-acetyltransferase [Bacteroidota bacterium]
MPAFELLEPIESVSVFQVCPTLCLPDIVQLRKKVWDQEGIVKPLEAWRDPLDELAIHFVAKNEDQLVGAARLIILQEDQIRHISRFAKYLAFDFLKPMSFPFGFFSRLVVDPDFRGRGIGRQLKERRLDFLQDHFVPTAILTSQHPGVLGMAERSTAWIYGCKVDSDAFLQHTGLQSHLYYQQF